MISESREGTLALIMPLVWCQHCGGDRPAVALVTGSACAYCRTPFAAISPLERYLSARIAGAVIQATRAPDAPGSAGLTPPSFSRKEAGMSTNPTEGTAQWRQLVPGTVLVRDPEHPDITGSWEVLSTNTNGWDVFVHARSETGAERTFHVFQNTFFATAPTSPEVA